MPGYFVHIASAPEDVRSSILGLKGIIAPDLWKQSNPTENEYIQFFDKCIGAPSFEQVKFLCSTEHGGTHFGSKFSNSNYANFTFLSTLFANKQFDADNLFFKGYIHHLSVDKNFYSNSSLFKRTLFEKDFSVDNETTMEDLHFDWDKTNFAISTWYPEVLNLVSAMPDSVRNVIGFENSRAKYVDLSLMKQFIEDMRKPRSLAELLNGWNFT